MSFRMGNITVIVPTENERCELCGCEDECRPAGPKGENVCHPCGMKDPIAMKRYMDELFGDAKEHHA